MSGQRDKAVTRGQLAWSMAVLMVACLSLAGVGIVLSNARVAEAQRKFCAVVAQNKRTEKGKLDGYINNPPVTSVGIAQRDEVRISYSNYVDLERDLECPPSEEKRP